ncbi:antifreeze protein [Lentinula edodes]|uniref:Antifreeze protein n=1 Tax=Lentinula edodes TaxID=5353 RepID=A0A1Q3DYB6_LENED|nr:antifreeze protein [Lentinula edodes]
MFSTTLINTFSLGLLVVVSVVAAPSGISIGPISVGPGGISLGPGGISIGPGGINLGPGGGPGAINLGPAAVNLRTAGNYAILAKSGISTVPESIISGNIGVSPISTTAFTGFSETLDSTGKFATSQQVIGELFAASFAAPTPTTLTTAVSDMQTAFNDATGRVTPDFTNLGSGELGGLVLTPGLYKWTGAVSVNSTGVTIAGTPLDHFIFQIPSTLGFAAASRVTLVGGILASNIVWAATSVVTAGAGSHIEGVVLAKTAVTLETGATMNGRILAQTFVALQSATVVG